MLPDYYAHIRINNNIEEKQTVLEHLEGVSELAESFAESFNAGNEGRLAGLSHDIGKYSMKFQKRLLGGTIVDHSTAGAYECWKLKNNSAAVAVAGHHGGIPNYGSKTDTENDATFCGRMKRARNGKLEDYSEWRNKLDLPQTVSSEYRDAFHIRMLYSALVDADFLDTETFMNGGIEREKCRITISELYNRFEQSISCWYPPKGKLNNERCKILDNCKALADRPSGLFKLTVPTGAGKTVASLAFALRHAIKNNLKHVIYVIPYTSIIEQTADIFREKLGCDAVLEHHSLVDYESQSENEADRIKMIRATENWDMPIIVTSAVQFFESIFSNKPSKCRKLHNIAKSVVIFDEAQMIPIPYLIPCTDVMSQLIVQCNSSCVLCTATQPSLERFFPESIVKNSVELCPNDLEREVFKRVKFQNDGMLETAEVAERMINFDQVLCIVNSRKAAKELFELLPEDGRYHLSTFMMPQHRRFVLSEIRKRLSEKQTCRVVSTSLIEAGVDVDFPAVLREITGLDSVLQAAGRCNREGKMNAENCRVTIFEFDKKSSKLFSQNIHAYKYASKKYTEIDKNDAIDLYFRELYSVKGDSSLDEKGIIELTRIGAFADIAEHFHLIEGQNKNVIIPTVENESLVNSLREGMKSRELFQKLGLYTVALFEDDFKSLYSCGAIELVSDDIGILSDLSMYSEKTGLSTNYIGGQALWI